MLYMNHFHSFLFVTFPLSFNFYEIFFFYWRRVWDNGKGTGVFLLMISRK